jgi:hypothetical protein
VGVAAQEKRVTGSMVIQTLGISGENVSPVIPMPGDLSMSSIQSAIQALSTIKSKMYDPKTTITPRIIALFNSIGGGIETRNSCISAILADAPGYAF